MLYWLIALAVFVLDQWTKRWIVTNMDIGEEIPVIEGFFSIDSHRNRGAAWGILQDQRTFFILVTVVVVVGVVWYMTRAIREGRKLLPVALALLLGGALGNFVDRVRSGEVVDFLHFVFDLRGLGIPFVYDYPIFNVADMGIVIGVALIFVDAILGGRRDKREVTGGHVDG